MWLAGDSKARQGRAEIGWQAGRVVFEQGSRNEIGAHCTLVDRALPAQLDPSEPAIGELGDHVSGFIQ